METYAFKVTQKDSGVAARLIEEQAIQIQHDRRFLEEAEI